MNGDAVVGMNSGVSAFTMTGTSTPTMHKPSNYLSFSSYTYVNGTGVLTFSRSLAAPTATTDVALSATGGGIGMVFAVGPSFSIHRWKIGMNVPATPVATAFVQPSVSATSITTPTHSSNGVSSPSSPTTTSMSSSSSPTTLVSSDSSTTQPQIGDITVANSDSNGFSFSIGMVSLVYTVDGDQLHMTASAVIPASNYLAVGFALSDNEMVGTDSVIAMQQGVNAYKIHDYTASGITNYPKPAGYLINPSYFYDSTSGTMTMKFSRLLSTGGNDDIPLDVNAGVMKMIFASGMYFQFLDYYVFFLSHL